MSNTDKWQWLWRLCHRSILHGIDPSGVNFQVPAKWSNLQQGLENKNITTLPHRNLETVKHPLLKVSGIPIFSMAGTWLYVYMYNLWKMISSQLSEYYSNANSIVEINIIKCLDCRFSFYLTFPLQTTNMKISQTIYEPNQNMPTSQTNYWPVSLTTNMYTKYGPNKNFIHGLFLII